MPPPLHIVFSPSAQPALEKALGVAGRPDAVIGCPEIFSMGPIDPGDSAHREAWLRDVLALDLLDFDPGHDFWRRALATDRRLIAWTSTRVAQERAGFLEWLWRLDQTPCEVIDLSAVRAGGYPAILGLLEAEDILSIGLLDTALPLSPDDRARHHQTWRRLRDQNAPLRIIRDGELASAPLEAFDARLLSHLENDWIPTAQVVGAVLADAFDDYLFQVNDRVLISRLKTLIAAGAVEARPAADPKGRQGLWADEVRLPPGG